MDKIKKLDRKIPIDTYKGVELNLSFLLCKVDELIEEVNKLKAQRGER